MKTYKAVLMSAVACTAVLSSNAAIANNQNDQEQPVYSTLFLGELIGGLLSLLIGTPQPAVPVTPPTILPLDAQNPYRHADGTRSNNRENALNSWRNNAQFRADYSKQFLGLEYAYIQDITGAGINIGINDEGIHTNHPLFSSPGKLTAYANNSAAGYANNGQVHPRRPYASHGSHVAGTAAGSRIAGQTMFGAAFDATITSASTNFRSGDVRWAYDVANNTGVIDTSYENVIGLSNTAGVRIINNSWGSNSTTEASANLATVKSNLSGNYADISKIIRRNDTLVVFAAGNDEGKHANILATAPLFQKDLVGNWLSVVNVQNATTLSPKSNQCGLSAAWCVAAPGHDIVSASRNNTFNQIGFNSTLTALELDTLRFRDVYLSTTIEQYDRTLKVSFDRMLAVYLAARRLATTDETINAVNQTFGLGLARLHALKGHSPDIGLGEIGSHLVAANGIEDGDLRAIIQATITSVDDINRTYRTDNGLGTTTLTGTSMAAPSVSGFAALLMQKFPEYDTALITDILTSSSNRAAGSVGRQLGWGVPQMNNALNGPMALRANQDVEVRTGTVDTWSNNIVDARTRYAADIRANHEDHIGGLTKIGGGELIVSGNLSYTGNTRVTEGLLTVNGTIATSPASVAHLGIIGGTGSLASLEAQADGIVAPGSAANPYGTLTVSGNANFLAGSYLWIRAREAGTTYENSRVNVLGNANITDASVIVKANNGTWTKNSAPLTILTAGGTLTGQFDTVTTDLAYLTPSLTHNTNTVALTLTRNANSIADAGTTPAERAVGAVLDVLTGRPDALQAAPDDVVARNAPAAAPATAATNAAAAASLASGTRGGTLGTLALQNAILDSSLDVSQASLRLLTGEVHASLAGLTSSNAGFLRSATLSRGRTQPNAGTATQAVNNEGVTAWATGSFGNGRFDGNDDFYRYRSDTQGFTAGLDKTFANGSLIGVAIGQNRSELKINGINSHGRSRDNQVALYGSTNFNGFGVRAGASYIKADVDTNRSVSINRLNERLLGDYDGDGWQAYAEVSAAFGNETLSIEPYVNYAHYRFEADVSETGGASALGGRIDNRSDLVTGGVRLNAALTDGIRIPRITAVAHLAYTDDLSDKGSAYHARLVDSSSFLVNGFQPNDGAVTAELGVNIQATDRVAVDVGYSGLNQSDFVDHRAYARLSIKF